ncbi:MAG: site-specific DNA-methyltransferase [Anaerolinea sp.]|nr:site-specific DNA-methyltransferase [Anaerolinea sp.]
MPKPKITIPLTSIRHADKRTNIPTEELRGFVADEEKQPKTILYPRDPSLDPQLVWRGKDEQDQHPLEVPAVPVYIQEKIEPQAIIENIITFSGNVTGKGEGEEYQPDMFGDFNHIEFEDLVDFYHHEQNWTNRMILGDSLLVMTSLAEKENLKGKVQMIYLDPPYGIKFGSNWQVSTRKRDVKDGKEEEVTIQPEQIKAFRDTWELGIHSYLAYLRDRLTVARELLTESGSIFVQIGDENVHIVRSVMDEVFGSENFCRIIKVYKTTSQTSDLIAETVDYLLWYAKNKENIKFRRCYKEISLGQAVKTSYQYIEYPDGSIIPITHNEIEGLKQKFENGSRLLNLSDLTSQTGGESSRFSISFNNRSFIPNRGGWRTNQSGINNLKKANRLGIKGQNIRYSQYLSDFGYNQIVDIWDDLSQGGFVGDEKIYVVQTNPKIIERCMLMTTDPGDLVLDPTCGSGTTAYVAEQWGRRWITIDTSRVAVALARTRLMSGRYPYYQLADSVDGKKKENEISPTPTLPKFGEFGEGESAKGMKGDIRKGFVYERVPHITLKSIANNEEIDVIYARWQEEMEPLRAEINRLNGTAWEEWEMPRVPSSQETSSKPSPHPLPEGEGLILKWWELRRDRQKEIDASIGKRADVELLYDKPYEDKKRVRITGPFTVESLSPHRMLSMDEERPESEKEAQTQNSSTFHQRILDNLRKAGVQNTRRDERIHFTRLDASAGEWLHASGEYNDADGKPRRVAVCIGPEHGTVSPDMIREAAKEASKGIGFDLLVMLGFAFDPHVGEETKNYGALQVLPVRMSPDLMMEEGLLKKTGAGNLFMVFGEPDVKITKQDGKVVVEMLGVDIYDPTTGEVRSNKPDEIACWLVDTDYNGESFYVRHAYFTGADQPYDKLKRALRAEINEEAWLALYRTVSLPFDPPAKGKIAVKVINHYGDEVLKVFDVNETKP